MKTTCQSCGATVAINDRMTATQAARVLARRAAAAPSPARQAASRANGRKGGRPRRRPTTGAEGMKRLWKFELTLEDNASLSGSDAAGDRSAAGDSCVPLAKEDGNA